MKRLSTWIRTKIANIVIEEVEIGRYCGICGQMITNKLFRKGDFNPICDDCLKGGRNRNVGIGYKAGWCNHSQKAGKEVDGNNIEKPNPFFGIHCSPTWEEMEEARKHASEALTKELEERRKKMNKKSSKFHFIIDFGEDLTLEQAEQRLGKALASQQLSPSPTMKIEDVGIASDRILAVYLAQKEFELLHKRVIYEETYLGVLVRKIIQKSLSEWEAERKKLREVFEK